jgi:DNA-binding CsgD family transcriptional regulator
VSFCWGWNNGFVLPVHGPGGYFATVSMASPERDLDLGDDNRLHLQMIAMLAHERCHLLAKLASVAQPIDIMSARELECLRWVAAGKSDWEIGSILSISAATVKFHLNGARAKLDARTRAQAVARLSVHLPPRAGDPENGFGAGAGKRDLKYGPPQLAGDLTGSDPPSRMPGNLRVITYDGNVEVVACASKMRTDVNVRPRARIRSVKIVTGLLAKISVESRYFKFQLVQTVYLFTSMTFMVNTRITAVL